MTETPTAPPLLVDAKAAAGLLGISRAHLYGLLSSGRMPGPIHLGRRTLWRTDELRAWTAAGCPSADRWQAMKGNQTRGSA